MGSPLTVDYYTDVLCIWAWIAQRRVDELKEQWGEQLVLCHHYINLFGDTGTRIEKQWAGKGGFAGFGEHVLESAAPFESAPVNADVWSKVRPKTSANAHLVLKAVEIVESTVASERLAVDIRRAFFVDALDIGQLPVLYEIATAAGIGKADIRSSVRDGTAAAALMQDYQLAQTQGIAGSPSWVMDGGRQKLYGNVGYRVLHANVEGLLTSHHEEASWC